ncbi:hypothetical protein TPHA_0I01120 [Tetrapisispora phaffii CBS 4417]|uniref:Peptide hydrolase n=1 Tax=Tetrapisispora phaffii (strain ATCC 24235 / CBS 4417 / NBRC 1672 / NRRL Y-8282 / UCD 70-5) TaxID=1071381 RepID=G8BXJ0_TETPH|nr:hypothetical protein TPHA_0I01120 [Tetrapisispora phaffii CBS 4417]CCE64618.1 hypothetical protein TPHA_0I01120 [Tetrapisispora phaffii CBS 4417]
MLLKTGALFALSASISSGYVLPEIVQEAFQLDKTRDALLDQNHKPDSNPPSLFSNILPHIPYFLKPQVDSNKLQESISIDDLNATAWDLYHIAEASEKHYGHPTRVIGSKGHRKTIKYILKQFDQMKDYYDVSLQHFDALSGKINSFNLTDGVTGEPFINSTALSLSPPVKPFTGRVVHIANLGCNEEDYKVALQALNAENSSNEKEDSIYFEKRSDKKDKQSKKSTGKKSKKHNKHNKHEKKEKLIALIERGQCSFGTKSELAGKFGFEAAVIFDNDPQSTGLHATLEKPKKHTVSTIGVTYQTGQLLITSIENDSNYTLNFAMDSYVKNIRTVNVIADTKRGDPNNIIGLGAHSDSVEEGPGINDDGSGTISLLTVAKQLTHFKITNKVRFAWWSAEEEGLLGSNYYADHLCPKENSKIRMFMDYDMMASPNYEYEVYDANNIDNPKGSEELRDLYIDYYKSHNLNYTLIPFDGRSDYVGFINNGIPAGGIAAGAEKDNVFNGGVLDKCYHLLCDDVSNLAWDAFLVNTKLIAHSVATYANSLEGFPVRENSTLIADDVVKTKKKCNKHQEPSAKEDKHHKPSTKEAKHHKPSTKEAKHHEPSIKEDKHRKPSTKEDKHHKQSTKEAKHHEPSANEYKMHRAVGQGFKYKGNQLVY